MPSAVSRHNELMDLDSVVGLSLNSIGSLMQAGMVRYIQLASIRINQGNHDRTEFCSSTYRVKTDDEGELVLPAMSGNVAIPSQFAGMAKQEADAPEIGEAKARGEQMPMIAGGFRISAQHQVGRFGIARRIVKGQVGRRTVLHQ